MNKNNRRPIIPNTNGITAYLHCSLCLAERPPDVSPAEFSQLEVGLTKIGLQVWCRRHEANVCHIDFQGQTHPAKPDAQAAAW